MMNRSEHVSPEDRVYDQIKKAIMTHMLPSGSQLVETRLAEKFGVSRTPVRNALRKLCYEGLVRMVPNFGAFVAEVSAKEIEQIFQVREELEGFSARLAAENASARQMERLAEILEREKEACRSWDFEAYVAANDAFHGLIADASGNEVLSHMVRHLLARSSMCLIFYDSFFGVPIEEIRSIEEHGKLLKALRSKEPLLSEQEMRAQIRSALEHLNLNYLRLREARSSEAW